MKRRTIDQIIDGRTRNAWAEARCSDGVPLSQVPYVGLLHRGSWLDLLVFYPLTK